MPSCRGGLEQIKAIEPNAGVCGPAMKARWLVIQRAERTFIGPLLGTNEAWYRPIFWHSTQELGLLPVSEEIVRAILLPQVGWRSSMSGSHGVPDGCLVLFDSRHRGKLYRSLSQHGSPLARESHYKKQGVVKRVLVAHSPPTSKLAPAVGPDHNLSGPVPPCGMLMGLVSRSSKPRYQSSIYPYYQYCQACKRMQE